MIDSASVFNQHADSSLPTENVLQFADPPPRSTERRKKRQSQSPRQTLTCTKCSKRKVKCDRTWPCSACCARGAPKECQFKVREGEDIRPILLSDELRKLRVKYVKLIEYMRRVSPDLLLSDGSVPRSSKRPTKQRTFKGQEQSDHLYFGSPGPADVFHEFKPHFNLAPQTLAYAMPRGAEIYAPRDLPPYPFPIMWPARLEDCIPSLLDCLPPRDELMIYLDAFEKRVQFCSFPHVPNEITKAEVDRFLSDSKKNAELFPDMLALLFAALALGSQHSVFDSCGGKWVEGAMEREAKKGDVYIAAAKQSLRIASSMNRRTLLVIQTSIMFGSYLINSGRFLHAWTQFGTTIRLAQSIGLHRHPEVLDPTPPPQDAMLRRTLWWWMLHMDQQYSMTLGRPLGISGIGDCPPPEELTTDPTVLRFSECVNTFTLLARQILSSDRLNNAKIDEFTDELLKLWDTVPQALQFGDTWLVKNTEIPEWPMNVMAAAFHSQTHNCLILLNSQRIDEVESRGNAAVPLPPKTMTYSSMSPVINTQKSPHAPTTLHRGRSLVLSSSMSVLSAFLFYYDRTPAALISWTMGQQAFHSCMLLLLDAMETGEMCRIEKVERAYAVFVELEQKGVHKLAALAVERISWGLSGLRNRTAAGQGQGSHIPIDTVMSNTGMFLLEDPGLQCFVPESFEPLTRKFCGNSIQASNIPGQREQEYGPHQTQQSEQQNPGEREHEAYQGVSMSTSMTPASSGQTTASSTKQGFRSGTGMTGDTRPPQGSAPQAYATFYTAPSHGSPDRLEQGHPQCLTSPLSPLSGAFTGVVQQDPQQHKHQSPGEGIEMLPQPAPALCHRAYSSTAQPLPSLYIAHDHTTMQSPASLPTPQTSAYPSPIPKHLRGPLDSGTMTSSASSVSVSAAQPLYYTQQMAHMSHPSWAATPAIVSGGSAPIFPDLQNYEDGTPFGTIASAMDHSAQGLQTEAWPQQMAQTCNPSWAATMATTSGGSGPIFSDLQNYEYGTHFGSMAGAIDHSAQGLQAEEWKQYLVDMTRSGRDMA